MEYLQDEIDYDDYDEDGFTIQDRFEQRIEALTDIEECEDGCICMYCIMCNSKPFIPVIEDLCREAFKPSRVEYSLSCGCH